ncbi:MAG TPA: DUF2336 domain-containing protein [Caulobacteraceae bacterium]|nr:DUF2336 domain-containing protein [Caulobacteraceae bacterium]
MSQSPSMSPAEPPPNESPDPQAQSSAAPLRSRAVLFKRLADTVCLPSSRINAFERSIAADLLVEMLRDASVEERARAARRLSRLNEIPTSLLRLLLRDTLEVAKPLIEECTALDDSDLVDCARRCGLEHRLMLAARKPLSTLACEAIIEAGEPQVMETLLKNDAARLSSDCLETIVAATREHQKLAALLLRRPELRPRQAYVMFWWADEDCRRLILQRLAVSREVLQDAVSDVFLLAAQEQWQDPLSRKALQFIERRQRNRAALDKSPFASLEEAVAAAQNGMTRELAEELSYLAGIKPMTGAKIFSDPAGEPLAVYCKACGLPRAAVRALWRSMRRAETDSTGQMTPAFQRVLRAYDMIAVDRAQTVLRYWNWSLSSALTTALIKAIRDGDGEALDEYSVPQRVAMLALSTELNR